MLLGLMFNLAAHGQELGSNLSEMADKFTCLNNTANQNKKPELYVFVSLSMPENSLSLWSHQAEKVGGVLLLRGFINNSFQETTQQSKLHSFNIDPEKFQKYNIKQVPAVVITTGENDDIIYGDTSLEAALEYISHHGSESGKTIADNYLKLSRKRK